MFAKKYRLPSSIILQNPLTQHTPFFLLRYTTNNLPYNRYGFVSSKKIDKRATVRNHARRILRSRIESLHPHMQQGYDLLFHLKKSVENATVLNTLVEETLQQAHLL